MSSFKYFAMSLQLDPMLSFFVRSTGEFQMSPPAAEKKRLVDFGEIFWCIGGRGRFRTGGKEYYLEPEKVWYYPPGSFHDYEPASKDFHYCFLGIDGPDADKLFSGLVIKPGLNPGGECPVHLFTRLRMDIGKKLLSSEFSALATAFQILTMVSEARHPKTEGGIAERAKNIMDTSFAGINMNVSEAANRLGVHPGSLSRAFSKEYGISAAKYLSLCRLNHAKTLLSDTTLSIREAARLAGFHSHEYFSHVFREYTGMSPAEFRSGFSGESPAHQKNRTIRK